MDIVGAEALGAFVILAEGESSAMVVIGESTMVVALVHGAIEFGASVSIAGGGLCVIFRLEVLGGSIIVEAT